MLIQGYSQEIVYFDDKLIRKIAEDMVNFSTNVEKGEDVLIFLDPGGRQLALELAKLSLKKGARVYYLIQDRELNAEIIKGSSKLNIARFFSFDNIKFFEAEVTFLIRCPRNEFVYEEIEKEKMIEFNQAMKPAVIDFRVNYSRWCLIYLPTQMEAKIEGLKYEDYVKIFFQSCQRDWVRVKKVQEKLCQILDKGKELILIANSKNKDPKKRTRLEMSIEGMDFINSTIEANYPGSEVYSSPIKNSVNGQVFAEGVYSYSGKKMEDIYLKFENGKIVEASAKKGENNLIDILDSDEGAKYIGEIALGTNYKLKRRLFNPLLNEKVGGSFHFALGRSYRDEYKDGKLKRIYNGNDSLIHWDITILMHKKYGGGEVIVDGKTIQKDGLFVLKELQELNHL
ncbi:MAG: hypothetical protein C4348_01655 [Patescibacteria group bacterium]